MYGYTYSKGMDQPGKVANPASIDSFITAIRCRVSPELIGSRNCVSMAFTAESPPARGQ